MKRIPSQWVVLPTIIDHDDELAKGKSLEETEELNAASIDYGRNTAIPNLEDNVTNPFSNYLKQIALREAVRDVGAVVLMPDKTLLVKKPHPREWTIGAKKFVVHTVPSKSTRYEPLLTSMEKFLDDIVAESSERLATRGGIRKAEDGPYILLEYFVKVVARYYKDNTTRFTRQTLTLLDIVTGKELPLDEKRDKMLVYFDVGRYSQATEYAAEEFFNAKSLHARINAFIKDAQHWIMLRNEVPAYGLTGQRIEYYELSDGRGVRYLFFPNLIIGYGKIYAGLFGGKTDKGKIATSTGDITIIKELAFRQQYEFSGGGAKLAVINDTSADNAHKGRLKIIRRYKDGMSEERHYALLRHDRRVDIRVSDIKNALELLQKKHASDPTELKIDFFPATPAYLIR